MVKCLLGVGSFKCGIKKAGTRIVGGTETAVNEYPWMIHLLDATGENAHGCGATLVGSKWVITAAHCIVLQSGTVTAAQLKVGVGFHDLGSGSETAIRKVFEIEKIILHEGYSGASFKDDIALLKLKTVVDLSAYTPACLPSGVDTSLFGKTAWVYGWGTTEYGGGSGSDKLLEVSMPIVSTTVCKAAEGASTIVDGMICAGENGKDSCQGDSGGPMTVEDATTKQHTLVGVVSFGEGCAKDGRYGVYADVGYYKTWMDGKFAAEGGIALTP